MVDATFERNVCTAVLQASEGHVNETGKKIAPISERTKVAALGLDSLDAQDLAERFNQALEAMGVKLTTKQVEEVGYCAQDALANDWTLSDLSSNLARELQRVLQTEQMLQPGKAK